MCIEKNIENNIMKILRLSSSSALCNIRRTPIRQLLTKLYNSDFPSDRALAVILNACYQEGKLWFEFSNRLLTDLIKSDVNINHPSRLGLRTQREINSAVFTLREFCLEHPEDFTCLQRDSKYKPMIIGIVDDVFKDMLLQDESFYDKNKRIDKETLNNFIENAKKKHAMLYNYTSNVYNTQQDMGVSPMDITILDKLEIKKDQPINNDFAGVNKISPVVKQSTPIEKKNQTTPPTEVLPIVSVKTNQTKSDISIKSKIPIKDIINSYPTIATANYNERLQDMYSLLSELKDCGYSRDDLHLFSIAKLMAPWMPDVNFKDFKNPKTGKIIKKSKIIEFVTRDFKSAFSEIFHVEISKPIIHKKHETNTFTQSTFKSQHEEEDKYYKHIPVFTNVEDLKKWKAKKAAINE